MTLYCEGLELIEKLQNAYAEQAETFLLFSRISDPRYAFTVFFPLAYCLDKHFGLKVLWLNAINEWLNGILKWLVRDDRPYWHESNEDCSYSSSNLKQFPITCETGPGFPSGHVMANTSLLLLGLLHVFSNLRSARTFFLILAFPCFAMFVAMGAVSRVFIATHFPHQVMAGFVIGVCLAYIMHELSKKYTPKSLFTIRALPVGFALLASAYTLHVCLIQLELNPSSTIELAINHCARSEWVHLDTTIFSAVTRDAAVICGLGVCAAIVHAVLGDNKDFTTNKASLSFYDVRNLLSACIVCPFVYYVMVNVDISQQDPIRFYALFFLKNLLLPVYVLTIKFTCEVIFMEGNKKCKSC